MDNLTYIAEQFMQAGRVIDVREFGNGNINNTFLVTLDFGKRRHETCPYSIMQRINTQVFPKPELVMQNMRIVTEHICQRLKSSRVTTGRPWEVPRVLLAKDGNNYWCDSEGSFWRAISFINAAESFDVIRDNGHAEEAGYALGMFHSLISDLPPDRLADTLEGFHITPLYLKHYDAVMTKQTGSKPPEVNYCLQFISERSAWANVLENAKARGRLHLRPIHGDPKVNNIMMDTGTGQAVGIVDLDTVKPGLIHYDIGDCLRSGCNPIGEETELWETVQFDTDICRALLQGYLSAAREFLSEDDYEYIYDAARLLAFELGLRFFTDYLEGNVYFRVVHPEHNLVRALVQFKLTESIESQEADIRAVISDLR